MESQILVLKELRSRLLLTSNLTQPTSSSKRVVNQPTKPPSKRVVNQLWAICGQKTTKQKENLAIAGYNLRTKLWTIWDTPIEFRPGFAATLLGEDLIVMGGSSNGSPVNTVTKLNIPTMVTSEMAPLKTSRTEHAVAVLNGAIYAIGGYNGRHILNTVERWDPVNQTWHFIPVMEIARRKSAAAVINGRLYVSGGASDSGHGVSSVEYYDPVENNWRSTTPMKLKRYCLAAHKGYLFAIGGYRFLRYDMGLLVHDSSIVTERYDPFTDKWTSISYSPTIYFDTRYASLGSELFIYNANNSRFYTISSEGSCDNLQLQIIHTPSDAFLSFECKEILAIPFEFSPPGSWIRNAEF